MVSYTWSSLWGNYTGLTTTDQTDGGGVGRNSPDTTRAFDEPFYYFGANGQSNNGPLPTDRPNEFKGSAYYDLPWSRRHGMGTTFGIFQSAYQGAPISSFIDLGTMFGQEVSEGVDVFRRSQLPMWRSIDNRCYHPWYATYLPHALVHPNRLQPRSVVEGEQATGSGGGGLRTQRPESSQPACRYELLRRHELHMESFADLPGGLGLYNGAATYQAYESGYNTQQLINAAGTVGNSWYGQPYSYQSARTLRFTLRFNF